MTVHLYFSLIPEALIASMLPPDEFGTYYAVGSHKKLHGQAMFIELDPNFRHDFFKIEAGIERCVPHDDGSPKRSVYISTYRVLEHVPIDVMQKLYLVTAYGEVLGIESGDAVLAKPTDLNMYQEIAPVHPLVVSTLSPKQYYQFLTQIQTVWFIFRRFVLWICNWVSWRKIQNMGLFVICLTVLFTICGSACWKYKKSPFIPKL